MNDLQSGLEVLDEVDKGRESGNVPRALHLKLESQRSSWKVDLPSMNGATPASPAIAPHSQNSLLDTTA